MTQIDKELEDKIALILRQRFPESVVRDVSIKSVEVSEEGGEIRFVVQLDTDADAAEIAEAYFGLTRRVRNALGERWKDFFPIITPVIGRGAHV